MSTQSAFFHALLRPSILQILRATGYHSARPSVIDSLTDIAARYLTALCLSTASHAVHNHGDAGDYSLVDVLMALQDVGAVQPAKKRAMGLTWQDSEKGGQKEEGDGDEDEDDDCAEEGWVVDEFVEWFAGQRMRELMLIGRGDGEIEATDYLSALKKKHSKTAEESKYTGTVIGKPLDTISEIQVEGGPVTSIDEWIQQRRALLASANAPQVNGHGHAHMNGCKYGNGNGVEMHRGEGSHSSTLSSGLSSVGSRLGDDGDEMDLS
ncbi:related to TAF(II) complex (TBP-associated protein complex) component [Claviceps purpurea 20.1]|uniref:Related to TAF(II) complex (TBP-associated protein complex) component n=1 Tax=Claviceps purpurea (strain 20.1) TaxID=1111077 RepID=M1WEA0_CLAP2|nr:hypothetical protein E4U38_004332 [Claviceps purpurea]CCE35341.1 related to TAF(II) complex (TBP-associated protein complex) component [Claviceps purpurea 20.1]KAG6172652.1 hypothetical protein E4U51_007036 [Claviceps purpurea]KAG6192151.1 hypothetical protein E4U36_000051 [Claviceps purpurea]KAG6307105.1 hypothetical protein E4U45_005606 [Claviceps purpurea]